MVIKEICNWLPPWLREKEILYAEIGGSYKNYRVLGCFESIVNTFTSISYVCIGHNFTNICSRSMTHM